MLVATVIFPVVAPAGTVAVISVDETTVNAAAVPLKLTEVDPVRLFPRITTLVPAAPEVDNASTNGANPVERPKTVPHS